MSQNEKAPISHRYMIPVNLSLDWMPWRRQTVHIGPRRNQRHRALNLRLPGV